jgi:hypothetical protein
MEHTFSHDLDLKTATNLAQIAFEYYRERFLQYNPQLTWTDEQSGSLSLSVFNKKITGDFRITDNCICLNLHVPLVFRVFRKKAIGNIESEIQKWINKASASSA